MVDSLKSNSHKNLARPYPVPRAVAKPVELLPMADPIPAQDSHDLAGTDVDVDAIADEDGPVPGPQPVDRLCIERPRPSNERPVSGQQLSITPLIDADYCNGSGETFALIGEEKVGAAQLSVGEQPTEKRSA